MKVTMTARQMSLRESLKEMTLKKLEKLDKFFPNECEANVTFSCKRDKETVEITIFNGGTIFRCEIEDESFQNALDKAMDTMERQIRKNKTRLEKRMREGAFREPAFLMEEPAEKSESLIRRKSFTYKPMSVDEAILQMDLLGHSFFVFKDAQTEGVCVVYRRKDGNYGLITPEE